MCRSVQESEEKESPQTGAGAQVVFALNQFNLVATVLLGVIYLNPYKSVSCVAVKRLKSAQIR